MLYKILIGSAGIFANRNRWLTTIRYMSLKNLLLSLLIALPLEFIINMIKSFKRKERLRLLLYSRILLFLVKRLSIDLKKRVSNTNDLEKFIVNVKSPLSKEIEAVAKERKETQIYVPVENYIGTARATLATVPKGRYLSYTVSTDTLDNLLDELGVERVDLLKIDIEGYVLESISGMMETLKKYWLLRKV